MAQIIEEKIVVTISTIAKNSATVLPDSKINDELLQTLESVLQELVGEDVIIEVEESNG